MTQAVFPRTITRPIDIARVLIAKSCQVRCMCGRVHRVSAGKTIACQCGVDLSIETPYKKTWLEYIPYAEMDDSVPHGCTPDGNRAFWPYAAVVGK